MRFGAATFIWTGELGGSSLLFAVERVAALGFDFVELPVADPSALDAAEVADSLARFGVGASVLAWTGPDGDLSSDSYEIRRTGVAHLQRCVAFAAAVGAPRVGGGYYAAHLASVERPLRYRTSDRTRRTRRAAEALGEVAACAGEHGLELALEPLNRFESQLVNTVSEGLELCELIGHENVGLLLDTFHLNIEEADVPASIERAGPKLRHVHACENDRGAPGKGHLPWPRIAEALVGIGYDGDVALESFGPVGDELRAALNLWRVPFEDPDEFAAAGLAHLAAAVADATDGAAC